MDDFTEVVNPLTIKALLRVEGKRDKRAAATLARLAATFDLRPANMPNGQQQDVRYEFKVYDEASQARIRIGNRLRALLIANGCRLTNVVGRGPLRETLVRLFWDGKTPEQIARRTPGKPTVKASAMGGKAPAGRRPRVPMRRGSFSKISTTAPTRANN